MKRLNSRTTLLCSVNNQLSVTMWRMVTQHLVEIIEDRIMCWPTVCGLDVEAHMLYMESVNITV